MKKETVLQFEALLSSKESFLGSPNRKEEMETPDGQSNLEYTVRLAVTSNPIIFRPLEAAALTFAVKEKLFSK